MRTLVKITGIDYKEGAVQVNVLVFRDGKRTLSDDIDVPVEQEDFLSDEALKAQINSHVARRVSQLLHQEELTEKVGKTWEVQLEEELEKLQQEHLAKKEALRLQGEMERLWRSL